MPVCMCESMGVWVWGMICDYAGVWCGWVLRYLQCVWVCACTYVHVCLLCLQEIELKDFTQHITPKTSVTSLARAPGYDFTPFTDHAYKKGRGQTEHTALSPPNFDFTSMNLNVSMKSPQSGSISESGSGSVGAVGRRRRRRYSDHFGNVRELRSIPQGGGGRRLWSGGEEMNFDERENIEEEVPSKKRSGCLIVGEYKMGSLTDSSNSKQGEGRNEHFAEK